MNQRRLLVLALGASLAGRAAPAACAASACSKIEADRMELEPSCFDLDLLLDNSLTLVRERAQRHRLAVALEVGDGLEWVAVRARSSRWW